MEYSIVFAIKTQRQEGTGRKCYFSPCRCNSVVQNNFRHKGTKWHKGQLCLVLFMQSPRLCLFAVRQSTFFPHII